MAVTLTQSIGYALPNQDVRVKVGASSGGNWVRVWLTAAPLGSAARGTLDASAQSRVMLHEDGPGSAFTFRDTVPGVYVLTAQEYTKGAADYGGGYAGAPDGFETETAVGSETALSIQLGDRLTQRVGDSADNAQLVVHTWGDYVRATSVAIHGEKSPALVSPSSARARTAVESSTVGSAVAALADVDVASATVAPTAAIEDFAAKFDAHIANATAHPNADTDNTIGVAVDNATEAPGIIAAVNLLANRLSRHARNADATEETWSGDYHNDADWAAVFTPASDMASATSLFAALHSAYEAHRVDTVAHNSADATNFLAPLGTIHGVSAAFAAAAKSAAPANPATANAAATKLIHAAGFGRG